MAVDLWVYAAAAGLALGHLATVLYVVRKRSSATPEAVSERAVTGDAVECARCGTENEPEYRFCRECVTELPGGTGAPATGANPRGRGIL